MRGTGSRCPASIPPARTNATCSLTSGAPSSVGARARDGRPGAARPAPRRPATAIRRAGRRGRQRSAGVPGASAGAVRAGSDSAITSREAQAGRARDEAGDVRPPADAEARLDQGGHPPAPSTAAAASAAAAGAVASTAAAAVPAAAVGDTGRARETRGEQADGPHPEECRRQRDRRRTVCNERRAHPRRQVRVVAAQALQFRRALGRPASGPANELPRGREQNHRDQQEADRLAAGEPGDEACDADGHDDEDREARAAVPRLLCGTREQPLRDQGGPQVVERGLQPAREPQVAEGAAPGGEFVVDGPRERSEGVVGDSPRPQDRPVGGDEVSSP